MVWKMWLISTASKALARETELGGVGGRSSIGLARGLGFIRLRERPKVGCQEYSVAEG